MRKLRRPVRAYVVATLALAVCGLTVAALAAPVRTIDVPAFAILLAIAATSRISPIHVSTKMKVTTDDAATFAGALMFGPFVAMQLVLWSSIVPSRLPTKTPLYNRLFNVAVKTLSVGIAAAIYESLAADRGILLNPVPVVLAAVSGYLAGTILVDVVVALQLRRDPVSAWWPVHQKDIPFHAVLYALGALAAIAAEDHAWVLLLLAAPSFGVAESLRRSARLRDQTRVAIAQLADLIDRRDKYTYGHSQRVAGYARQLATRMGLSPAQVDLVTEAARLHDLGKVATPDGVLLKPGKLTDAEREVMHAHAEHGFQLLKRVPEFWEGAALVRAHHERADGKGYPLALSGPDLPLEASIIAVCDAFDAMSSDRVYRRRLSTARIFDELRKGRGTQWDARVVDELVAMLVEAQPTTLPIASTSAAGRS